MSLQERLSQELKDAMRAQNAERLSTLRLLKSAAGYALIEHKAQSLTDSQFITVVQKEVRKRRDSIEQFERGGRTELAEKEKKEIAILETFLPEPLRPEELEKLIKTTIQELGATSKKEMGPVIKAVQSKAAGRVDGRTVSAAVSKFLP
jgi:uncharacterized protein YqeY